MPAKRIGLFGGTFDPVHKGHQSIAESFLRSGLIDKLWVLLTPFPPHKQDENHAGYDYRYQMLEAVFGQISDIHISTIENELPKPSYSVQTIRYLKKEYPDHQYYFCMGEDSLAKFHTWKYYEEILQECDLLVARRPGESHDSVEDQILHKTHFVDHDPLDIASSDIKSAIKQGKEVKQLLNPAVYSLIEKEQLYR